MSLVSIRGAITVEHNTKEEILQGTETLLKAIIEKNTLNKEEIIQILFTATKDLDAVYPAVSARALGLTEASLMCMQEMYVEGSLKKCIRVAVLVESKNHTLKTVKHQYLRGAQKLRPDLLKGE